jgi:16S rRNA (cytidine1402-2'-O)-methyltransferase
MPRRAISPGKEILLPGEAILEAQTAPLRSGSLYVVAIPIGNPADISYRAGWILAHVDVIIGESLPQTRRLQEITGSQAALLSTKAPGYISDVITELRNGRTAALVCDAGTPCIADPGLALVTQAVQANINIISVPGASAVTAALAISGISAQRFVFEGFAPRTRADRPAFFAALRTESRTVVMLETHRYLKSTLHGLSASMGGERSAAVARNLTLPDEEVFRGTLSALASDERAWTRRGQYVIVVAGL